MEKSTIKILLIEDNPAEAALFTEILNHSTHCTYQFQLADHLEAALHTDFAADLIILDLNLPDSQGLDSLDRTLQCWPDTPVVIFTGNDNFSLGLQSIQHGAQDFLDKNFFNLSVLEKSIMFSIERKKMMLEMESLRALAQGKNP